MSQPLPLRDQLKVLEQIQELDLKIGKIEKQKGAVPAGLKGVTDSFLKVQKDIAARKNSIIELEKSSRQTQAAIDLNADRLARAKTKLETVQNSQEFQAANKEIDQLNKLTTQLDEQIKKVKEDTDKANADIVRLEGEFTRLQGEKHSQESVMTTEVGQLDSELKKILTERNSFVGSIAKPMLSLYDRVRGARAGIGLAPAVGGRCSACNMILPPQLYNEVQKFINFQSCPSCHRILFVPQSGQGQKETSSAATN